jgi:hypothetical protein
MQRRRGTGWGGGLNHAPDSKRLRKRVVGSGSLRRSLAEYSAHYIRERPHQGLGNRLNEMDPVGEIRNGRVERRARLGGLLNFYRRTAA